ncbi:hypothetical protein DEU56DRAFT_775449 [Suillus clintonianus]|uniref:uncharacterized protein n=1 Tax=Suillus clintonianus TaxID=1904413 RepID=UPI001B85ED58|nr:uncharacterized protein DEU56DRAFT_775449 [Suillus clintonianus]KAG2152693.1 hypothetical protein DEU56DRAFT_775449 [Suillus clintonianus]
MVLTSASGTFHQQPSLIVKYYQHKMNVQNLYRNFSFLQMNAADHVVGNNIGGGSTVQIIYVDKVKGTANLWVEAAKKYITIDGANQVVGGANEQLLQLDLQGNGSYVIRKAGDPINRLLLDNLSGPVTYGPAPLAGAADFNKQYWMLVAAK